MHGTGKSVPTERAGYVVGGDSVCLARQEMRRNAILVLAKQKRS